MNDRANHLESLLQRVIYQVGDVITPDLRRRIEAALSQQAEPVAPAPAQGERELVAAALRACDWSSTPIGNKAIIQRACELLTRPAQTAPQPERDREADRARFPDPVFNKWLDEGISDAGHTVWDQVNVCDAWAGWENRQWYTAPQHTDDEAVDRFAAAMKAKLAAARAKGRGGWDDAGVCAVEFLAQLLVEHLGKGNAGTFEDVANFAMMLHQRGADPKVLAEAAAQQPEQSGLADLPYQTLFNAIAASTDAGGAPISISIKAFRAALPAQGARNE